MKNNDVTKHHGFKKLKSLMENPRYWREQDPAYVEMIRQGFRDLYDSPARAGQVANKVGANGNIHAQDNEVGHLTKGEVVIPLSAQTPEVMQALHQVLGKDMLKYTVGSGYEKINPTSGLPAYADEKNWYKNLWEDVTRWHYEDRDAKNIYLPENVNDARQRGSQWEEYPSYQNKAHDNGRGEPERKFVHPDGREAIYDGDTGKLVTDPKLRGTYNYINARNLNKSIDTIQDAADVGASFMGHFATDYLPWKLLGNDREGNIK